LHLDYFSSKVVAPHYESESSKMTFNQFFKYLFIFILFANVFVGDPDEKRGKLIVFAGISGSGKSTLSRELGKLMDTSVFCEPEEDAWPEWVVGKRLNGKFNAYVTFRSLRLNTLWHAQEVVQTGKVAIVDSYYDKITSYYLGKPGMEWLIEKEDPYYTVVDQLTKLDNEHLPNADLIILLDVTFEDWIWLLNSRGRGRDTIDGFRESYSMYRSYIKEAIVSLNQEKNIPYVIFNPTFGDPKKEALRLYELLQTNQNL